MGDKKEQQDVPNPLHFLFTAAAAAAAAALSELHQSVYTSQTCCSPTNFSRSLTHIHSHASLYTWTGERAPSGEELHRRLECRPWLENCLSSGNVRATLSGSPSVSRRPSGCTRSFVFSLDDVFRLIGCDCACVCVAPAVNLQQGPRQRGEQRGIAGCWTSLGPTALESFADDVIVYVTGMKQ